MRYNLFFDDELIEVINTPDHLSLRAFTANLLSYGPALPKHLQRITLYRQEYSFNPSDQTHAAPTTQPAGDVR